MLSEIKQKRPDFLSSLLLYVWEIMKKCLLRDSFKELSHVIEIFFEVVL